MEKDDKVVIYLPERLMDTTQKNRLIHELRYFLNNFERGYKTEHYLKHEGYRQIDLIRMYK